MDLDHTDRALVDALLADGRASIEDVAAAADVGVETAERRIEALEDAGVIRGYTATIDDDALGYDVTAVVRLRVGGSIEALAETFEAYSWARSVYEVTGEDDFLLVGRFLDTDDMHENVAKLLTEPAVRSVTVDVVVDELRRFEPRQIGNAET